MDDAAAAAATQALPLELLERSLAWTRPALAAVPGHRATEPTPCAGWDLAQLLAHMLDGFSAFVEGAAGWVLPPEPGDPPRDPRELSHQLLDLGCVILSSWGGADDDPRRVGHLPLPVGDLLEVAALEIAVHGWDVSRVCAPQRRLPTELAAALLPVAYRHITRADRPGRFGPALDPARRDPTSLLLAHTGRRPAGSSPR